MFLLTCYEENNNFGALLMFLKTYYEENNNFGDL
jgi:hypothetical protein